MTLVVTAHPPAPPPAIVTPLQARRALRRASEPVSNDPEIVGGLSWAQGLDLVAAVAAYIAADATGQLAEEWDYAVEIERASSFIEDARIGLGLTIEQMDDLFRLAGKL